MKTKTKILSLLVAMFLVIGLMPAQLGALDADLFSDIKGPIANVNPNITSTYQYIYYGETDPAGNGIKEPLKWRILDNSGGELFLLSDELLTPGGFDNKQIPQNTYGDASIRNDLISYVTGQLNLFTATELAAIRPQSTFDDTTKMGTENSTYSATGDKLFLPSLAEAKNATYFPGGEVDRTVRDRMWWLRSARTGIGEENGVSIDDGNINSLIDNTWTTANYLNLIMGIRPAFKLNLSDVVYVSPANAGLVKIDSDLATVSSISSSSEMKLTLVDNNINLTIDSVQADNLEAGTPITVNYSGASTSTSHYLYAELTSGNNSYRGAIRSLIAGKESGKATFILPMDITSGNYTLKLWNEYCSLGNRTNYANIPLIKTITTQNITISSTHLPAVLVGTTYNAALTSQNGTAPYTWSATGMPAGLTINSSTGAISGTQEDTGISSVTIQVTDASNHTDTKVFILGVYSLANIKPTITIINGISFSVAIYNTNGTLTGINTIYGTLTGTASGNDTIVSGTLTGVPRALTEITLGSGKIKIKAVNPPSTTVVNPSFY